MQVQALPGLITLIVVTLTALFFLLGRVVGSRRRSPGLIGVMIVLPVVVMGAAIPFSRQQGALILIEAGLLVVALDLGLLLGYSVGRSASQGRSGTAAAAVLGVLILTDLTASYFVNKRIVDLAQEAGLVKETPQEAPKPEAPVVQDSAENLKNLYNALAQYADSNEGDLPPAENWMDNDDFKGYVQDEKWFHCPVVSNGHDDKFGYAYNDAVAGRKLKGMPDAAHTPLLYESSSTAKSAHDAVKSLPKPGLHNGKNEILFCDGHVEAVAPK